MGIVPFLFFCNDTATTGIYTYLHTLSLHDALPICSGLHRRTRDLHVLRHDEAGQSVRPLREAERSQHDDGAAGVAAVRVAAMVVMRGDVLADRAIACHAGDRAVRPMAGPSLVSLHVNRNVCV